MKKRIISIILAACLAIVCFAGCGKDDDSGKATNKPTASPTAKATQTATATTAPTQTPTASPDSEKTPLPAVEPGDPIVFRFDSEEDYHNKTGAFAYPFGKQKMLGSIDVSDEDGLILKIEGNDPYVYYSGFEPFDLSEYPYMKICIKNPTPATSFEIFFVPAGAGGAAAGDLFTGNSITAGDTEFKTYVFDIAKKNGDAFLGRTVEMLRLDCVNLDNNAETEYILNLKYIAFFKTEAEADAYN